LLSIDIETKNIDVVGNSIISGDGIGILAVIYMLPIWGTLLSPHGKSINH